MPPPGQLAEPASDRWRTVNPTQRAVPFPFVTERRLVFPTEDERERQQRRAALDRFDKLLSLVEAEIDYFTASYPVGPTLSSCYVAVTTASNVPAPVMLGHSLSVLHETVLDLQEQFTRTPFVSLKSGEYVSETVLSELAGRHGRGSASL